MKFTLSVEETNLILEALGSQPFSKVFAVIGKIQEQAASQMSENGVQLQSNAENQNSNE